MLGTDFGLLGRNIRNSTIYKINFGRNILDFGWKIHNQQPCRPKSTFCTKNSQIRALPKQLTSLSSMGTGGRRSGGVGGVGAQCAEWGRGRRWRREREGKMEEGRRGRGWREREGKMESVGVEGGSEEREIGQREF
ncbi:hypothetical protein TIFTF001_030364 [Ficus carica]|uniref:Uncharacterized protein n=1 Tax=Ficus carica TaxID=3494 RepID=A0AA88DTL0_FICCA|nr:hypothetical protein TIFTF001_030364 [Ficus carica]